MTMGLKARLAARDLVIGSFVKTPHPVPVEVLAQTALDCLCLDAEHAPFDRGSLDLCVMAARAGGMPVLVRPESCAPDRIGSALDCGADGVLLPHIRSAEAAALAVRASHFGAGGRGYAGSPRAAGYGARSMAEHLAASGARTCVVAQIEDPEAVEAIDAIAAVPGLDALFIGRIDLTVSLGAASPDDPRVVAAVEAVCAACVRHGRTIGMFLSRPSDVAAWRARGASFFLLGSDQQFLLEGAARLLARAGRE